jgi:protein SCO1/2
MQASPSPPPFSRLAAIVAGIAAAALLAGCSGGSSSTSSTASSAAAGAGFAGAALPAGIAAPSFLLTDQHGRSVSLGGYRGRVTVLSFLYPTCGATCVLVAQQIRGALDQLSAPVPVLLISAEPAADTPSSVDRFLAQVGLGGRAEYLSGTRAQLERLWRAYHVTPPSSSRGAFDRAASVLLVGRDGQERVLFGIEQLTPESLAHDIGKLQSG